MNVFGLARAVLNPMTAIQIAMGPAGWASLAIRAVVSQAAQAAIQTIGQQIGLPQSAIDMLQSHTAGALGDFKGQVSNYREAVQGFNQAVNASPFNAARNERIAQQTYNDVFDAVGKMLKEARDQANGTSGGKGKNWIRALVEAMGKRLDNLANEMQTLGKQVDSGAKKSGELQSVAAEFGLVQQALGTVMKTVAEGQQNLARKGG